MTPNPIEPRSIQSPILSLSKRIAQDLREPLANPSNPSIYLGNRSLQAAVIRLDYRCGVADHADVTLFAGLSRCFQGFAMAIFAARI